MGIKFRLLWGVMLEIYCYMATSKSNKERQLRARAYATAHKAKNPCACGENDPDCLDFHHKDPRYKVSQVRYIYAMETLLREMSKCVVICANCHRKGHAGRARPEHKDYFPVS